MTPILAILILVLGMGSTLPTWALEFTTDRITTIDGRTGKDALFYRDDMWRSNITLGGLSPAASCGRISKSYGFCCPGADISRPFPTAGNRI